MAHSQRPIAPVADNALLTASQLRVSLVIPPVMRPVICRSAGAPSARPVRGDPGRRAKHRRHDSRGPQAFAHDPGRAPSRPGKGNARRAALRLPKVT